MAKILAVFLAFVAVATTLLAIEADKAAELER